jgi:Spx/MgsR family transcriptional regulator
MTYSLLLDFSAFKCKSAIHKCYCPLPRGVTVVIVYLDFIIRKRGFMTKLYGIKNCDTIKKARKWLNNNAIDFQFHDYRVDGLDTTWLNTAESHLGWEALLNKRGTTFRQLSDEQKSHLNKNKALDLLANHPAMIKRPLLIHVGKYHLGFNESQYQEIFA